MIQPTSPPESLTYLPGLMCHLCTRSEPSISIDDIFEHRNFVLTGRRMARPLIAPTPPALRYRDLDNSKLISGAKARQGSNHELTNRGCRLGHGDEIQLRW
jgi:hypothetical protein